MTVDVQTEKRQPLTCEEIAKCPEFLILTKSQQAFVLHLIETQNPLEAARRAYPKHKHDEGYLRVLLFKMNDSVNLQTAIAKAYGLSDREQFIRNLQRQAQRLKGVAKVQALALLGQATGAIPSDATLPAVIDSGTADAEQQTYAIGTTIKQDGKLYRVTTEEVA